MISRKHPCANWVLVSPSEHRAALNKVLDLRDQADDQNASGLPPEALSWFWREELPRLMQRPDVRVFAAERITELTARAVELRQRIERQIGSMGEEAAAAETEARRIGAIMQEVES